MSSSSAIPATLLRVYGARVGISPDTKDWTWVLDTRCAECGFDTSSFDVRTTGAAIRRNAAKWRDVLGGSDLQRRPSPHIWSPLEYACHVRDVFRLYDVRLMLMLTTDDPDYPNWDQDATAVVDNYNDQDPTQVSSDLALAAEQLAGHFDEVDGNQWLRTGNRSDGKRFSVESFARYMIHDPIHHLHDVGAS
jgi:hypothetical protein